MSSCKQTIRVIKPSQILSYHEGLRLQERQLKDVIKNPKENQSLIICQHRPVYTFGRRQRNSLEEFEQEKVRLELLGADVFQTNRGGLVTFHGPGQLVCYPILSLNLFKPSVKWYINCLEEVIIRTCQNVGVAADRDCKNIGIWVEDRKVCAIGVRIQQRCTSHGIALNCNNDLIWFDHVVACGLRDKGITNLSRELKRNVTSDEIIPALVSNFAEVFNVEVASD